MHFERKHLDIAWLNVNSLHVPRAIFYKVISGCARTTGKGQEKMVRYFLNLSNILMVFYRFQVERASGLSKIKPIRRNFTSFLTFIQLFADVIIRKIRYSILSKYLKTLSSLIITSKIRKVKNVRKILNFVSAKLWNLS